MRVHNRLMTIDAANVIGTLQVQEGAITSAYAAQGMGSCSLGVSVPSGQWHLFTLIGFHGGVYAPGPTT